MTDVVRSVTVRVRGDIANLEKAYDRAGTKTDAFADKLERAGENSKLVNERQGELGATLRKNNSELTTYNKHLDKMGSSSSSTQSKVARLSNETASLDRRTQSLGNSTAKSGNQIDRFSGRLLVATQALVAFGPGVVAGATVPLAGLFAQAGAGAVGLGVLIGSFQGVKDAVTAINKTTLDPSITNLNAEELALSGLSPAAQKMARDIATYAVPALKSLRDEGAASTFPGLERGAEQFGKRLPDVKQLVHATGVELGVLGEEAGRALSGKDWDKAFNYGLKATPGLLADAAHSAGDFTLAAANLWVALDPLTQSFSGGLLNWTRDLAQGSKNLDSNKGFQAFLGYAEQVGPEVADTLGDIVTMLVKVGEAGAPISGPLIKGLGALANIVGNIADSDLGTPLVAGALAMTAYGKATDLAARAQMRLGASGGGILSAGGRSGIVGSLKSRSGGIKSFASDLGVLSTSYLTAGARSERESRRINASSGRIKESLGKLSGVGKGAAVIGAIGIASSGAADGIGLTNTATLALAGSLAGPFGIAAGAGVGLLLDAKSAADKAAASQDAYNKALQGTDAAPIKKRIGELEDQGYTKGPAPKVTGAAMVGRGAGYTQILAQKAGVDLLNQSYVALDRILDLKAARTGAANARLLSSGLQLTAEGAEAAQESTQKFTARLENLSAALTVRSSLTSYKSAVLDIADALKKNGKTLDLNTRAGLDNRSALESLASTALARAKDLSDAGDRVGSIKFLKNAQGDLARAAAAFGLPIAQARALARRLLDLGLVQASPKVLLKDLASGKLHSIRNFIQALDGTSATTYVWTIHKNKGGGNGGKLPGPSDAQSARGNIFYSNGGMDIPNGHQPELADGKQSRVWNEPETHGEAYIPLADDSRRPRAKEITALTANRLGGTVTWNANGSFIPGKDAADYNLAHLQLQQQIAEDQSQLKAKKKGHFVLKKGGLKRQVVEADLASTLLALRELEGQAQHDLDEATNQTANDAADTLNQTRQGSIDSLRGGSDLFAGGSSASSVISSVNRLVSDISGYGQAIKQLRDAKASPALLNLVKSKAESGDFRSATRLAKALLAQPALFTTLNSALGDLDTVSSSVGAFTTDPSFLAGGALGGPISIDRSVSVNLLADMNAQNAALKQEILHEVTFQISQATRTS